MGISRKNKPLQAATNQNIKNNRLQFTIDFKMHSSIIISIFLTLIAVSSANYCRPLNSDSIKVHRYLHQLHSDIKTIPIYQNLSFTKSLFVSATSRNSLR